MTPAEFKRKWARDSGKESAAYQEHFNDLCRLLQHPTPAEADPTGSEFFCFQKHVVKDAELFDLEAPDASEPDERPAWLDLAHKKLDAAVAAAYGWPADLTDEQILERLLALNLERAAEEAKAAKVMKPKAQRAKAADELV